MSSFSFPFSKPTNAIAAALIACGKAVAADGGDGFETILSSMVAGPTGEVDKELRLSLIRLKDGTFTFTGASETFAKTGSGWTLLVAGSGNSACEIALDLVSHGAAETKLLVGGPRQFVPIGKFGELMRAAREQGSAPCFEERAFSDWTLRYGEPGFTEACDKRCRRMVA